VEWKEVEEEEEEEEEVVIKVLPIGS